jgi:CHAD domain-containing protein
MADGKWIDGLQPDMPWSVAAELVLGIRLRTVHKCLRPALHESWSDPEHVHQLRVATRRADAALRIFRVCLPSRLYKAARDRLRNLRRAAGEARDQDVLLLALEARQAEVSTAEQPGVDFLIAYALGQRVAAQDRLLAVGLAEEAGLCHFLDQVVDSIRLPDAVSAESPLIDLARPLLTERLQRLHRAASGDLTDYGQLHQVRIAGKRLRYAMEVFADCFAPVFRENFYPQVEQMQEILGRANDSHVAGGRLRALEERLQGGWFAVWLRVQAGIEGLLRYHEDRLPEERERFLAWWQDWTRAEGETGLLAQTRGLFD